MPDEARPGRQDDRMDHVADVFVDEFRGWARAMRTRDARLHLSGYIGTSLVFVYEQWPDSIPGLLVGDVIDEDWDTEEPTEGLFTLLLVGMLEPGGRPNFHFPALVDRSIIHWEPSVPFGEDLPRTPEQLRAGVVPPGFISRLPDPWPGPAPAPPRQPRPPLKKMLADLAEFAVVYSIFRIHRHRHD